MDTTPRNNKNLMPTSFPFNRVLLIVLDGAGIGAMPDAPDWGDAGADTFLAEFTFGELTQKQALNSLRLFTEQVMPELRKIDIDALNYPKADA